MDAGQDLVATYWAAVAAAAIVAVPTFLVVLMTLLFGSEVLDVPSGVTGTYLGEPVVLLVGLGAPLAAAVLVGPSANLVTVILVVGSVFVGEVTFFHAWEPFLALARGRHVLAALATVSALALGAAVTLLLTRVLPAVVGPLAAIVAVPLALVVVWLALAHGETLAEGGEYWLKDLTVDGDPVEIHRGGEVFTATRLGWRLSWTASAWEHEAGQVAVSFTCGASTGVFTGEGLLARSEDEPAHPTGSGEQSKCRWVITGMNRVLRLDGKRVLVS